MTGNIKRAHPAHTENIQGKQGHATHTQKHILVRTRTFTSSAVYDLKSSIFMQAELSLSRRDCDIHQHKRGKRRYLTHCTRLPNAHHTEYLETQRMRNTIRKERRLACMCYVDRSINYESKPSMVHIGCGYLFYVICERKLRL